MLYIYNMHIVYYDTYLTYEYSIYHMYDIYVYVYIYVFYVYITCM